MSGFWQRGWTRFPTDPALLAWRDAVRPAALAAVADPANAGWLRHGGTWFAGVNVLINDTAGAVPGGPPLAGRAVAFAAEVLGQAPAWDRAQISVVYPGYPRRDPDAPEAAHRYRRDRDAAHIDGLLPVGPDRRRMLREPHGFVLGLPITQTDPDASPLVVWEGSHETMRAALGRALAPHPPQTWPEIDLTEPYHAARRQVFRTCRRVALHAAPGEAYLIHRLTLHGVAPWAEGASAPPEGRVIAYFRPEPTGPITRWIADP